MKIHIPFSPKFSNPPSFHNSPLYSAKRTKCCPYYCTGAWWWSPAGLVLGRVWLRKQKQGLFALQPQTFYFGKVHSFRVHFPDLPHSFRVYFLNLSHSFRVYFPNLSHSFRVYFPNLLVSNSTPFIAIKVSLPQHLMYPVEKWGRPALREIEGWITVRNFVPTNCNVASKRDLETYSRIGLWES